MRGGMALLVLAEPALVLALWVGLGAGARYAGRDAVTGLALVTGQISVVARSCRRGSGQLCRIWTSGICSTVPPESAMTVIGRAMRIWCQYQPGIGVD
jgi:hypothetical protein